jgi:hypothetical protein
VERLRLACTPPALLFKNINGTGRLSSFMHGDTPHLLSIQNYTFEVSEADWFEALLTPWPSLLFYAHNDSAGSTLLQAAFRL